MMKRWICLLLILSLLAQISFAQTLLTADGPGSTYELINSVLAPGFDVVEVPDCNHAGFGRHIDEVFDSTLNQFVFRFQLHTTPDNDRCINFDRQRNEIKTYDKSPDHLKGVQGERVEYKWKFKLANQHQSSSSFTHIHQLKAVGGSEDDMPQITLTTRKGTPDKLELRYAESTSQTTLTSVDLTPFKGTWVSVRETVLYGEIATGEYAIEITRVSDSTVLFSYSNDSIRMWKTDADFIRPKWGIYRSLNQVADLRDEALLFADFSVEELINTDLEGDLSLAGEGQHWLAPNPFQDAFILTDQAVRAYDVLTICNMEGKIVWTQPIESPHVHVSALPAGMYVVWLRGNGGQSQSIPIVKK